MAADQPTSAAQGVPAPSSFLPSRDLPSLREPTLLVQRAYNALLVLRKALGVGEDADKVVFEEEGIVEERGKRWVWDAPGGEVAASLLAGEDDLRSSHETKGTSGRAEPSDFGNPIASSEEDFENRTSRAWLQRLISGRVQLIERAEEDEDDRGEPRGQTASDATEEDVLNSAAETLSLMAGRAASGPSIVTYVFRPSIQANSSEIEVPLRDGTLVEDALGNHTWGAAPLLSMQLISSSSSFTRSLAPLAQEEGTRPLRVLELGAGTGLVGLALAAALQQSRSIPHEVWLTDHHPTVLENLQGNVQLQSRRTPDAGAASGKIITSSLDWYQTYKEAQRKDVTQDAKDFTSHDTTAQTLPKATSSSSSSISNLPPVEGEYDVILAAECVYDLIHPVWLRAVAEKYLARPTTSQRYEKRLPLMHILSAKRPTHAKEIEAVHAAFPRPSPEAKVYSGGPDEQLQLCTFCEKEIKGFDDFSGVRWKAGGNTGGPSSGSIHYSYLYLQVGWVAQPTKQSP